MFLFSMTLKFLKLATDAYSCQMRKKNLVQLGLVAIPLAYDSPRPTSVISVWTIAHWLANSANCFANCGIHSFFMRGGYSGIAPSVQGLQCFRQH